MDGGAYVMWPISAASGYIPASSDLKAAEEKPRKNKAFSASAAYTSLKRTFIGKESEGGKEKEGEEGKIYI